jgi:hypothetical protein
MKGGDFFIEILTQNFILTRSCLSSILVFFDLAQVGIG